MLAKISYFICSFLFSNISLKGTDKDGSPVFLRDIWPSRSELQEVERRHVLPVMFKEVYSKITEGNDRWNKLEAPDSLLYPWDDKSTYIKKPPFLETMVSLVIAVMRNLSGKLCCLVHVFN